MIYVLKNVLCVFSKWSNLWMIVGVLGLGCNLIFLFVLDECIVIFDFFWIFLVWNSLLDFFVFSLYMF